MQSARSTINPIDACSHGLIHAKKQAVMHLHRSTTHFTQTHTVPKGLQMMNLAVEAAFMRVLMGALVSACIRARLWGE
jgi:hypothetical protein